MSVRFSGVRSFPPEIVCHQAFGIYGVARTTIASLVERQKPRVIAFQFGAEPNFLVVHREVSHAAAQPEEVLVWVAVLFVLGHRICNGLLGKTVLQLEGRNGQAVYEDSKVKRQTLVGFAVMQLARYRETVLCVERRRRDRSPEVGVA